MEKLGKHHPHRARRLLDEWTAFWLSHAAQEWQMLVELKKINTPGVLIQGNKDHFGTFKQLETIASLSKSRMKILKLEDCGHVPHFEKEREVLNESIIFFQNKQNSLEFKFE